MFGRLKSRKKRIAELEESKERLLSAVMRYREQDRELRSELKIADELVNHYRQKDKKLRRELYEVGIALSSHQVQVGIK